MRPQDPARSAIERVLVAIAGHRVPGWSFPGHLLQFAFDEVTEARAALSLRPEPFFLRDDGQWSLGALVALADVALATVVRGPSGAGRRQATVSLGLQFSGLPCIGPLAGTAVLDGSVSGAAKRLSLARGDIHGANGRLATVTGSFMDIAQPGLAPVDMRRRDDRALEPADESTLDEAELSIVSRAHAAHAEGGDAGFLDRLWGLEAQPEEGGAWCRFDNGPQVGNRVGHTHGGVAAALAATSGQVAMGEGWGLTALSACYVGPGIGRGLDVRSRVVHRGASTGVVHTAIRTEDGRGVIDCVTQHHRLASGAS